MSECCEDGPADHTRQQHHDASPCYDPSCELDHPHGGPFPHPCDPEPQHGAAPNRRPWVSRFCWPHNLYPWLGGDEWCRRTLVVPLIFTSLVVPLWTCRSCEVCDADCGTS